MTEEQLTAIEARHTPSPTGIQWYPTQDVHTLVAEVRRLRTLVERAFQEGQDGRILDGHDQFVYDVEWKDSDAFKALDDS